MQRRNLLLGAAALGGALVAGIKPRDAGAPYEAYFAALNKELRDHGDGRPRLLIDLDLLDLNIAALLTLKKPSARYRLVEKSLPSPQLIAYVLGKTGTRSLMSFHLPFLQQDTQQFPDSDILLGKPLPVRAAAAFYDWQGSSSFDPARQLCWLIDSEARLAQYQEVARARNTRMRIAIEINVGLHRGGLENPAQMVPLLQRILHDPTHLQFAGLMGYDAHVGKIPAVIESRDQSFARATGRYQAMIDAVREVAPTLIQADTLLNGAGSPTFALHQHGSPCNDLSAGSCLLKPSDFDVATLQGFAPAAFIATPVLKVLDGTRVPGIEWSSDWLRRWNPCRIG